MTTTGWTGEDAGSPALPVTSLLMTHREARAGVLETALARSRADDAREALEAAAAAPDPDERAAGLVVRGVTPGMMTDLGQRLADVQGELAGERAKIANGERVTGRVRGMLERGQIGGLEASRMLDGDFGDAHRAEQLERRADNLRRQLGDAQAMIAPRREQAADGVEAASRHAHQVFREVTRAKMAAAEAGRAAPRPFGSRAGSAVRAEEVTCPACIAVGATPEQSFIIHHSDADGRPVAAGGAVTYVPPGADGPTVGEPVVFPAEAGRGESWPARYDKCGHEVIRACGYSDDGVYGNYQPVGYR